MTGFATIRQL
jgi:hypothetical protein